MRLPCVVTAAILAGLVGVSVAFAQDLPADLTQARSDRREAMIRRIPAAFDRLTAEAFVVVDQTGRVENKAERAARIIPLATPPQGPLAPPQRLNEHTAMYNDDTAIFFWQQNTQRGLQNFMETWVKEDGQWKCAATHVSLPVAGGRGGRGGRGRGGGRGGN